MISSSNPIFMPSTPEHRARSTAGTVVHRSAPGSKPRSARRLRRKLQLDDVSDTETDMTTFSVSSGSSGKSLSKYDLYKRYPSIPTSAGLLRKLRSSSDTAAVGSLGQVFASAVSSVMSDLRTLPKSIQTDWEYSDTYHSVYFVMDQLTAESGSLGSDRGDKSKAAAVNKVLDLMEILLAAVERYVSLVEKLSVRKPLPGIPLDEVVQQNGSGDSLATLVGSSASSLRTRSGSESSEAPSHRMSLAEIASEALANGQPRPHDTCTPPSWASLTPPSTDDFSLKTVKTSGKTILTNIMKKAKIPTTTNFFTKTKDGSISTASFASFLEELHLYAHSAAPNNKDAPYNPRQSALYYPADPFNPEIDVELPALPEDAMAIRLDGDNRVKAASMTALIRLLTSKDALKDPHFFHLFFSSFRFTIQSREILQRLMERFHEPLPDGMNEAQMRVWCVNHLQIVRPRIFSFCLRWLTEYWLPPFDDALTLDAMQDFFLRKLANSLITEEMGRAFIQAIDRVRNGDHTREVWLREKLATISTGTLVKEINPASFMISGDLARPFPLRKFDCTEGRRMLAHQLTLMAAGLYAKLPVQGVVRLWLGPGIDACEHERTKEYDALKRINCQIRADMRSSEAQMHKEKKHRKQFELRQKVHAELQHLLEQNAVKMDAHRKIREEIDNSTQAALQATAAIVKFERSLHLFVIGTMLQSANQYEVLKALKFWWKICLLCLELNNFSCAQAIFTGTTNSCISRMKDTLSTMGPSTQALYRLLNPLFQDRKVYSQRMLQIHHLHNAPVVPSLSSMKRTVELVGETIEQKVAIKPGSEPDGFNIYKFRTIGEVVSAIEWSRLPYKLQPDIRVQALLRHNLLNFDPANEKYHIDVFDHRSLELEPRSHMPPAVRKLMTNQDQWTHCVRKVRPFWGPDEWVVFALNDPKLPSKIPYSSDDYPQGCAPRVALPAYIEAALTLPLV